MCGPRDYGEGDGRFWKSSKRSISSNLERARWRLKSITSSIDSKETDPPMYKVRVSGVPYTSQIRQTGGADLIFIDLPWLAQEDILLVVVIHVGVHIELVKNTSSWDRISSRISSTSSGVAMDPLSLFGCHGFVKWMETRREIREGLKGKGGGWRGDG
jgi:hypothetical protein